MLDKKTRGITSQVGRKRGGNRMGVEISGSPCTISDIGFVLFLPQDPIPLTTLAKRLESISNVP